MKNELQIWPNAKTINKANKRQKKNNGDEKKIISMKQVFVTASVEAIQV